MDALLVLLGGLPAIVLYGIVGALLGGLGALFGGLLQRLKLPGAKYASAVGIALGIAMVRPVLIPEIEQATLNEGLPRRLDEVTVHTATSMASKMLTYHYVLNDVSAGDFSADAIKSTYLPNICETFRADFAADRVDAVFYEYTGSAGSSSFSVWQGECGF